MYKSMVIVLMRFEENILMLVCVLLPLSITTYHHYPFQVGENGSGKTTLLKILLGELEPVKGIRHCHRNLRVGYFSQHHVDQLEMEQTAIEVMASKFPGKLQ